MAEKLSIPEAIEKLQSGDFHMSYSSLKAFMKSPRALIAYMTRDRKDTPAMIYGKALHCLLLEGTEKFDDIYREKPEKITGKGSVEANELMYASLPQIASDGSKIIYLDKDTIEDMRVRVKVIEGNYPSRKLLERCPTREVEIKWEHNGIKFLGYVDMSSDSGDCIGELKTCVDATEQKIMYTIKDLKYYMQVAMYRDAFNYIYKSNPDMYSIFSDTEFDVAVYKWDNDFLDYGYKQYDSACEDLRKMIDGEYFWSSLDFFTKNSKGIYLLEKPNYL